MKKLNEIKDLYLEVLKKAESSDKLNCHINQIAKRLSELSNGAKVTALDEVWLEYFLNKLKREELVLDALLLLDEVAMAISLKEDEEFESADELIEKFNGDMDEIALYLSDKYNVPLI